MDSGIVRKVDELGRVVIPKEMRRTLGINTGSSIEMSVGGNGEVVLKRFSDLANILPIANKLAQLIYDSFCVAVAITDDKEIIACCGTRKDLLGRTLLPKQSHLEMSVLPNCNVFQTVPNDKIYDFCHVFSIKNDGFWCGYICIMSDSAVASSILDNIKYLADFLSRIVSE